MITFLQKKRSLQTKEQYHQTNKLIILRSIVDREDTRTYNLCIYYNFIDYDNSSVNINDYFSFSDDKSSSSTRAD
jgi:hypothetical protein